MTKLWATWLKQWQGGGGVARRWSSWLQWHRGGAAWSQAERGREGVSAREGNHRGVWRLQWPELGLNAPHGILLLMLVGHECFWRFQIRNLNSLRNRLKCWLHRPQTPKPNRVSSRCNGQRWSATWDLQTCKLELKLFQLRLETTSSQSGAQ
jgi:hypothetical protein